jgi:hypothetical protein
MSRRAALCAAAAGLSMSLGVAFAADPPGSKAAPFHYDSEGRRDPFMPLIRDGRMIGAGGRGAAGELGQPMLHGVLWDAGGHSIALIDDLEVKVGDTVAGYEVSEIRQDGVVLRQGERTVVLTIAFEAVAPEATMGGKRP